MELVWLVYGISLLKPIGFLSFLGALLGGIVAAILWGVYIIDEVKIHKGFLWFMTILPIFSMLVTVLIPNEKTAYTMVAAYAAQKVVERPETQDMAKDVLTIINSKVKKYALESVEELEKAQKK